MKPNLNETAYAFIVRKLSSGELKPGQKLSEPSLAKACGVSRSPMREAVRRLVEEGVLYQIVKSGTYVTSVGAKEVSDVYEIRSIIESALLAEAVGKLGKRELTTLQDTCNRMHASIVAMRKAKMDIMTGTPESDFLQADILFHLTLLRASGNSLAEKIIINAYRRNQFFGTHSHQRTLEHVALAWKYHCEILKACRQKNSAMAVRWLRDHIARSRQDALLPRSSVVDGHAAGYVYRVTVNGELPSSGGEGHAGDGDTAEIVPWGHAGGAGEGQRGEGGRNGVVVPVSPRAPIVVGPAAVPRVGGRLRRREKGDERQSRPGGGVEHCEPDL